MNKTLIDFQNKMAEMAAAAQTGYGNRLDGTQKGNGYFGPLPVLGGGVATEMSFSFSDEDGEHFAPLIVPTLSMGEIHSLMTGEKPSREIYDKAISYARKRKQQGKSPFAQNNEWE